LQDACLWDELARAQMHKAALLPRLTGRDAVRADLPFANLIASDDPAENRIAAGRYATLLRERVGQPMKPARIRKYAAHDRVAIGYLSSDFRYHPVGQLAAAILARHDRERFRVVAYSIGADDRSTERKAAMRSAETFRDLRTATDAEIAAAIREDGIDILVDLNGYTSGARSAVTAMRPAPVQVWLLGFPGTSGSDFVDYFISDRIALPPELAQFFSEQPCWLPTGCQPLDDAQLVSSATVTRAELGLPEEGFLFVCWQAGFKIEPRAFGLWMEVLKAVPDSHLWLRRLPGFARDNLAAEAARRGVDPARIVHAGRAAADKPAYLRHLACADLALDTLIYNGHATTSDLLMAGVPVVTLPGRHTAGRVAASLLHAAGLPELVTYSPRAYRDLAVKLARDPARLAALRARIAENRTHAPLFDTTRYVRALERGYEAMQTRRLQDAAPAPIAIGDEP